MPRFLPALLGTAVFLPAMVACAQTLDPPREIYVPPLPVASGEVSSWSENSAQPTLRSPANLADPAGWVSVGGGADIPNDNATEIRSVDWFSEQPLPEALSNETPDEPFEQLSDEEFLELFDEPFEELPDEIEIPEETPHTDWMGGFLGYRYSEHSYDWTVGNGDQFGLFTLNADHYIEAGQGEGIGLGWRFHFLGGPVQTDMPPRVFDFSIAGQWRKRIGDFGYDLAASVTASSDFEGSAREGIRYPAHAVGFWRLNPCTDLVFGADYLDRGDFSLLPVGGVIFTPNPNWRLELVFPRPRVTFRLTDEHGLFIGGRLGGGSWAVERVGPFDDLATYRDLQLCVGLESIDDSGDRSAVEIGYVFDRSLEYTSGIGDCSLNDTMIVRWVTNY